MTHIVRSRIATDSSLDPAERLIIAVFSRARIDLMSRSQVLRYQAELFLASQGFDVEEIRACWERQGNLRVNVIKERIT